MVIHNSKQADERLRVTFRFLSRLGLVVVNAIVIVGGLESDEYPTNELRSLFPLDIGDKSPKASTSHIDTSKQKFRFDENLGYGRAFILAN